MMRVLDFPTRLRQTIEAEVARMRSTCARLAGSVRFVTPAEPLNEREREVRAKTGDEIGEHLEQLDVRVAGDMIDDLEREAKRLSQIADLAERHYRSATQQADRWRRMSLELLQHFGPEFEESKAPKCIRRARRMLAGFERDGDDA